MTARDEGPPDDELAVWQELMATFHEEPADTVPPWPVAEDVTPREEGDTLPGSSPQQIGRVLRFADPEATAATEGDPPARPGEPRDEEDESVLYYGAEELEGSASEEHFVPPPPPPLPNLDPVARLGWVGLIGGPLYLIASFVLNWDVPGWTLMAAALCGAGGFVTLVARMRDRDHDDPDDGAVV